jgi:DUF971 family protein
VSSPKLGQVYGTVSRSVHALSTISLALLLAACTAAPAAKVTAAPQRQAVTVTGSGIMNSEPFRLSGDYSVDWTATASSDVGCYHGTSLEPTGTGRGADLISKEVSGTESGTVGVYGLASGSYYVRAASGCDWTFRFEPR